MNKIIISTAIFILSSFCVYAQDNATKNTVTTIENARLIDTQTLFNELKEREKALNLREADLSAKEERLKTIEQSILTREDDLKKMRNEVTARLADLDKAENEELDKLVKFYAASKPKAAATIIVKMDIDKSVSVFRRMSPSVAGKILTELGKLDPTYASKISEGLTPQPVFTDKK